MKKLMLLFICSLIYGSQSPIPPTEIVQGICNRSYELLVCNHCITELWGRRQLRHDSPYYCPNGLVVELNLTSQSKLRISIEEKEEKQGINNNQNQNRSDTRTFYFVGGLDQQHVSQCYYYRAERDPDGQWRYVDDDIVYYYWPEVSAAFKALNAVSTNRPLTTNETLSIRWDAQEKRWKRGAHFIIFDSLANQEVDNHQEGDVSVSTQVPKQALEKETVSTSQQPCVRDTFQDLYRSSSKIPISAKIVAGAAAVCVGVWYALFDNKTDDAKQD